MAMGNGTGIALTHDPRRGIDEMDERHERLPGDRDAILAAGARLSVKVTGRGDIEIAGNRTGLRALAAICAGLAALSPEELMTPEGHYHLDEDFWGTEKGSTPLTIWCRESGWAEMDR